MTPYYSAKGKGGIMSVSRFLSDTLAERGMTQADLARKTGLSTALIAQICSGSTKDPRMSSVIIICKALELSLDELAEHHDYAVVELPK